MLQKKIFTLSVLLMALVLMLSACGGGAAPAPPAQEEPAAEAPAATEEPAAGASAATEEPAAEAPAATEEPAAEAAATEEPAAEAASGDKVQIRWFCCLGTGDDPAQIPTEKKVVEEFNASHPNIELVLEIVDYDAARDALSTEIASGNPPDIVGPVGTGGAEAYHGTWLDLTELIETNNYDLSEFGEGSVDFYQVGGEGQVGIPFAIYPSVLFYQRDMFDEAGLEYPPQG